MLHNVPMLHCSGWTSEDIGAMEVLSLP